MSSQLRDVHLSESDELVDSKAKHSKVVAVVMKVVCSHNKGEDLVHLMRLLGCFKEMLNQVIHALEITSVRMSVGKQTKNG